MDIKGQAIGIVLENGFRAAESLKLATHLKPMGFRLIGVGSNERAIGDNHKFANTRKYSEINEKGLDGLIILSHETPALLRLQDELMTLILAINGLGKCIGSIGNGAASLAAAGISEGRRVTCDPPTVREIMEARGEFIDKPVVVNGNLVTCKYAQYIQHFVEAIAIIMEPVKS
ncbi:MAG: DJ-1/PfpI family protein [bacterium]|nr:DJ-1/PfpI family protein [bacterium]